MPIHIICWWRTPNSQKRSKSGDSSTDSEMILTCEKIYSPSRGRCCHSRGPGGQPRCVGGQPALPGGAQSDRPRGELCQSDSHWSEDIEILSSHWLILTHTLRHYYGWVHYVADSRHKKQHSALPWLSRQEAFWLLSLFIYSWYSCTIARKSKPLKWIYHRN